MKMGQILIFIFSDIADRSMTSKQREKKEKIELFFFKNGDFSIKVKMSTKRIKTSHD